MRLMYMIFSLTAFVSCSVSKNGVNENPGATKVLIANNLVVARGRASEKDNLPQTSIASLKEAIKQKCTGSGFNVTMTTNDSLNINPRPKFNNLEIAKTNYTNVEALRLSTGEEKSPAVAGWKLVWSDEFNYNGLPDSSKWSYETGGNGWGNNELEYYTEKDTSNAIVKDGHLMIIARKQHKENREYTSARLVTKNKADFKYGRIEVRAKVPAAAGTWPAIWMLGSNIEDVGWPACGEIDIMEHRGIELNKIFGTLHYPGHFGANGNGKTINIPTATTQFHKYVLEWSASEINIFVDNQLYQSVKNDSVVPFNHKFFIILNLAIGGNFGGKVDPSFSTDAMVIDYVRVFQ